MLKLQFQMKHRDLTEGLVQEEQGELMFTCKQNLWRKNKMEERKFVGLKKNEFEMKEYIKRDLGKGKLSSIKVDYTPVGEKITLSTTRPGFVIGRGGSRIEELTKILKERFGLENPHIEIDEIQKQEFDAQYIADEIAFSLERFGSIKFKSIAYKMLERIVKAGARGVEMRLSGKLPSDRARSWRFAFGYLKKTGETSKAVNRAIAEANTISGSVGVKVAILTPDVKLYDQVELDDKSMENIRKNFEILEEEKTEDSKGKKTLKTKKVKIEKDEKVKEK